MYKLRELRRSAVSLLFPNRCPFCDGIISATDYWCEECYGRLPFIQKPSEIPENLDGYLACCAYRGRAKAAVWRMKRGGYRYAPEAFSVIMTELAGEYVKKADIVTAVPTTFLRSVQLSYNHTEFIAKDIAKRSGKPFRRLTKKLHGSREQKKLSAAERLENARKSYKIIDNPYIEGKNILLVDDICTTGATLSVVAGLLKSAGADSIMSSRSRSG